MRVDGLTGREDLMSESTIANNHPMKIKPLTKSQKPFANRSQVKNPGAGSKKNKVPPQLTSGASNLYAALKKELEDKKSP